MVESIEQELLSLTQRLLDAITVGDWAAYQELCDPSLTAFEPEANGQRVEGLEFHQFYFKLGGFQGPHRTTICAPHVRLIGEAAVVSYVRLNQRVGDHGRPVEAAFEETRIWQRKAGRWKHVHFHRTRVGRGRRS